jgi:hypothetical protein
MSYFHQTRCKTVNTSPYKSHESHLFARCIQFVDSESIEATRVDLRTDEIPDFGGVCTPQPRSHAKE